MHYPVRTIRFSVSASLLLALCAGQAPAAHAQYTFFTTGTETLDASNPVTGYNLEVGAAAGSDPFDPSTFIYSDPVTGQPYNATVNLVPGGSVGFDTNYFGGSLDLYNSSVVNMSGGTIDSYLTAQNTSIANISGGTIGLGNFTGVEAYNSSTVNFSGGATDLLQSFDNSTVNFSGGTVTYYLSASDASTFNVTGGTAGYLIANNSSNVIISGGTFSEAQFNPNVLDDETTGSFTLIGNNLTASYLGTNRSGFYKYYLLSGTLADGSSVNGYVLSVARGAAPFTLVPEPGSAALLASLGVSGGVWLRRRRARA